jgi:hypothetical protein
MAAKRFAVIAAALSCIGAAVSPTARADPGNDFLAALDTSGIDLSALMGQAISPQDAIELGQDICNYLHRGTSVSGELDLLYREMPRITNKQAVNLVSAAQHTLCPDTLS